MTNVSSYDYTRAVVPHIGPQAAALKIAVLSLASVVVFSLSGVKTQSHAQSVQTNNAATNATLQAKVKAFLEPEAGLNNEIRAGLARLEQTCTFTNKSKSVTPSPLLSKSASVPKEVAAARLVANEQQAVADKAIAEFRSSRTLNTNSCAALPAFLRMSEQCVRYQADTETAQAVSQASQTYFGETLARFKSYEAAVDLEAKGCTRPDFAHKLWAAEQVHIVPKLKTSGQLLSDLLK